MGHYMHYCVLQCLVCALYLLCVCTEWLSDGARATIEGGWALLTNPGCNYMYTAKM